VSGPTPPPRAYLVTYAPVSNGGEYAEAWKWLKSKGGVEVANFSGWVVATTLSPDEVRDTLLELASDDADIVVAEITKGNVAVSDGLGAANAIIAECARFVPRRG
jgi:hypothetical protein